MSKISLAPDASGTGIFTIASPNSNTNRTLTLPDDTGTIVTNSGNQAGSFTTLNTSGQVVFNDAGADVDFRVEGDTEANLLFVDASTDRVGIGTSSPGTRLNPVVSFVAGTIVPAIKIATVGGDDQGSGTAIDFGQAQDVYSTWVSARIASPRTAASWGGSLTFSTNDNSAATAIVERARLTSGGDLLVGTTDATPATNNVAGAALLGAGSVHASRDDGTPVQVNRKSTDGVLVDLRKDGTSVGTIVSVSASLLGIGTGDTGVYFNDSSDAIIPLNVSTQANRDNAISLGLALVRFDDAYITNGVTTGSDRNDKQDIEELSEAEQRVAVACKALLRKWRWKDAVAKKGDDARIHFGIIAQDLKAAFEAEGLDAHRYGMFMWNEWWETQTEVPAVEAQEAVYETQTDEEGNEVQVLVSEAVEGKNAYTRTNTYETEEEAPEGAVRKERMGIRYNELLAFIIAAL